MASLLLGLGSERLCRAGEDTIAFVLDVAALQLRVEQAPRRRSRALQGSGGVTNGHPIGVPHFQVTLVKLFNLLLKISHCFAKAV